MYWYIKNIKFLKSMLKIIINNINIKKFGATMAPMSQRRSVVDYF